MFVKNVLLVTLLFPLTTADFRCLCNYNVELEVYSRMDISSRPIGYMYEFDCKANYGVQHVDGWQAIQFEHKVGYVAMNQRTTLQICPGDIPAADIVTRLTTHSQRFTTPQRRLTTHPQRFTTPQRKRTTHPQRFTTLQRRITAHPQRLSSDKLKTRSPQFTVPQQWVTEQTGVLNSASHWSTASLGTRSSMTSASMSANVTGSTRTTAESNVQTNNLATRTITGHQYLSIIPLFILCMFTKHIAY